MQTLVKLGAPNFDVVDEGKLNALEKEWISRLEPINPVDHGVTPDPLVDDYLVDPATGFIVRHGLCSGIMRFVKLSYMAPSPLALPASAGELTEIIRTSTYLWIRTENGTLWPAPAKDMALQCYIDPKTRVQTAILVKQLLGDITSEALTGDESILRPHSTRLSTFFGIKDRLYGTKVQVIKRKTLLKEALKK